MEGKEEMDGGRVDGKETLLIAKFLNALNTTYFLFFLVGKSEGTH